ncbi:hypothetical protein C2845_PM01G38900 [Panicum miliaceum]|uniref:Ripening-related protein 6 n=1 Tax=Panicum miliaceum TaxID=4540 RepID=A0A3L6TJA6_PANMI|nr:hypothetical protein C2845_PM01G38900 [Panicum miliaceum]
MARAKLASFLAAVAVLLLLAPSRAAARHHHHEPEDPCRHGGSGHRCSSPGVSPNKGGGGTPAVMTVNGNGDLIAALSTGWFAGGRRCHKPIRITSVRTGRSVVARVVDECDSRHGCKNNIVDTSKAVWDALGLDTDVGVVPVTWSDA